MLTANILNKLWNKKHNNCLLSILVNTLEQLTQNTYSTFM